MSEWISVDDVLLQFDFMVLVCCDDGVVILVLRFGYVEGDYWFDIEVYKGCDIIYWMLLFEFFKGE